MEALSFEERTVERWGIERVACYVPTYLGPWAVVTGESVGGSGCGKYNRDRAVLCISLCR